MKAAPINRTHHWTARVIRTFCGALRKFTVYLAALGGAILLALIPSAQLSALRTATPTSPSRIAVPFVGCRSNGQLGPVSAPNGKAMALPIAPAAAQRLTYYKSK
jgi:hypothetical protein